MNKSKFRKTQNTSNLARFNLKIAKFNLTASHCNYGGIFNVAILTTMCAYSQINVKHCIDHKNETLFYKLYFANVSNEDGVARPDSSGPALFTNLLSM